MMPRANRFTHLIARPFLVVCFGLMVGCGDDPPPPPSLFTGGTTSSECNSVGAPQIMGFTAPVPASSPSDPNVITADSFTVGCVPTAGDEPVDDDNVQITVTDASENDVIKIGTLSGNGVFTATFITKNFEGGTITIGCRVTDTGTPTRCAETTYQTLLDPGPNIRIIQPSTNPSIHSGSITVQFAISADPIADGDTLYNMINPVTLVVAGSNIPLDNACVANGAELICTKVIEFDDGSLFSTQPNGAAQLTVTATNGRGVVRSLVYDIVIDSSGPTIEILDPAANGIVGGTTTVRARVTDDSGVNPDSITLTINNSGLPITMMRVSGTNEYVANFDANAYGRNITELTINVSATDIPGNERTRSRSVKLDSTPAVVELDPPTVREGRQQASVLQCSKEFDPLGEDAVSDGQSVGTVPIFRAFAVDRSNTADPTPGAPFVVSYAGVADDGVQLHFLKTKIRIWSSTPTETVIGDENQSGRFDVCGRSRAGCTDGGCVLPTRRNILGTVEHAGLQ
ncbi:MAG: hypothetical protein R3A47_08945 [Polyangiales bacterium]